MSRVRDLADNSAVFADGITTADITEHTNLFFTDTRADSRIALKMVDEDNMSSNSAAHMPSQQSVKAYVDTEIAGLVASAPGTLDTLNELAAALGDDASFSTTVTNSIATKLPLAGGTMTGSLVISSSNLTVGNVGYWGGTQYGKLTWSATNNRAIVRGESGKNLSLGANGTQDYVFIKTDGNVGIGTNNPTSPLHVQADGIAIRVDGTANTTKTLFFRNTTTSNPAQIFSDGSLRLRTEDASTAIIFNINSTGTNNERLRINSAGLDVSGSVTADTQVKVLGSNASSVAFSVGDAGTGWYNAGSNAIALSSNGTPSIHVTSGGNVGIGTNSPYAILQTQQDVTGEATGIALVNNNVDGSADAVGISFGLARDNGYLFGFNAIKFIKEQAWTTNASTVDSALTFSTVENESLGERLRIKSNGNVGIGTNNPGYPLEVAKNYSSWVSRIYNTQSDANAYGLLVRTDATAAHNPIVFAAYADLSYKLSVRANGKVGIGTNDPQYKLDIGHDNGGYTNQLRLKSAGSTGYTQSAMVIESADSDSNPGNRGQGVYYYNVPNLRTWYAGTLYNNGNKFGFGYVQASGLQNSAADNANARMILDGDNGGVFYPEIGNRGDLTFPICSISNNNSGGQYLHAQFQTYGGAMYHIHFFGYDYTASIRSGGGGGYMYNTGGQTSAFNGAFSGHCVAVHQTTTNRAELVINTGGSASSNRWGSMVFFGGTDTITGDNPITLVQYGWNGSTGRLYSS